jgi:hypothetical protein
VAVGSVHASGGRRAGAGLRKQLTDACLDAGADTIGWHLQHHHQVTVSRDTINRILSDGHNQLETCCGTVQVKKSVMSRDRIP